MTDLTSGPSDARQRGFLGEAHAMTAERQLMLVDRIQMLQNELAEWRVRDQMTHQRINRDLIHIQQKLALAEAENTALRSALSEAHNSRTWRIGRTVMFPIRAAKWANRRRGRTAG